MKEKNHFARYMPVNNEAINFGLYITSYGHEINKKNEIYPTKNHPSKYWFKWQDGRILPEFTFVFIDSQTKDGLLETKKRVNYIKNNSFFMVPPEVWHRYKPNLSSGWRQHWVSFNGEIAHKYFTNCNIEPLKIYSLENFPESLKHLKKFTDILESEESFSPAFIAASFLGFVAYMESTVRTKEIHILVKKTQLSFEEKVKDVIWNWSHTKITAEDIAERLNISKRTLYRKLDANKTFSLGKEIDLCKLSRAKELLVSTNIPIKTVVNLAGYKISQSMRLAFLREYSLSPRDFRKLYGTKLS